MVGAYTIADIKHKFQTLDQTLCHQGTWMCVAFYVAFVGDVFFLGFWLPFFVAAQGPFQVTSSNGAFQE